jgi:hypothetical protein
MRAICDRNARNCRARKGHYVLRDLAGFADIERLLATDTIGERYVTRSIERNFPDVADDLDFAMDRITAPSTSAAWS